MTDVSQKRTPMKKPPSPQEQRLSLVLLSVLAFIAVFMLYRQARFDPAAWREQAVQPQSAGVQPAESNDSAMDAVDGWVPLTPKERYDADTLSDKIDGKADLYLSAGFRSLESRRFAQKKNQARWMERFVYDMGDVRNAFAVFSSQRRSNVQPIDLTPYAYLAGNGLFFVHGDFYVEIIAADASADAQAGLKALGAAFVQAQPEGAAAELFEPFLLPKPHRVDQTEQLTARSVFGIEGLDGVFTAAYHDQQADASAFIRSYDSDARAEAMAEKFQAFWMDFGGETIPPPEDLKHMRIVLILDNYEIAMVEKGWLFGVHEATDLQLGLSLVRQLRNNVLGIKE